MTDPDGKFWCSTKVDSTFKHQMGQWGYCDPDCKPTSFATTTITTTTTTTTTTRTTTAIPNTSTPNVVSEATENLNDEKFDGSQLPLTENENNYCGFDKSEGFIVGGKDAKIGAYPFIAALGIVNPKNATSIIYTCGGSLINRRYILTAAHCITDANPLVDVLLGEHDFSQEPDCDEEGCQSGYIKFSFLIINEFALNLSKTT